MGYVVFSFCRECKKAMPYAQKLRLLQGFLMAKCKKMLVLAGSVLKIEVVLLKKAQIEFRLICICELNENTTTT